MLLKQPDTCFTQPRADGSAATDCTTTSADPVSKQEAGNTATGYQGKLAGVIIISSQAACNKTAHISLGRQQHKFVVPLWCGPLHDKLQTQGPPAS
ncbi:MAG: hypothetical protein IT308_00705 [Anaerolineaceae bacterium]|nr:hypothetical protein [Anaerolineaceae bacterium]